MSSSVRSSMAVFPKVGGIFASAFTSLTDAYKQRAVKSGEGREWYLSVNDAAGYGEPNTLVTGILLMPIMLGLAFVLPGNTILPMEAAQKRYEKTLTDLAEESNRSGEAHQAAIFNAYREILQDDVFFGGVRERIVGESVNASHGKKYQKCEVVKKLGHADHIHSSFFI